MPKAKNTSPAATVKRFSGGQFAIDSDEGINVRNWGPERIYAYKATNLGGYKKPSKGDGKFSAHVKTNGSSPVSDETLGKREIMKRYGHTINADKGVKRVHDQPAHVGGGHPRGHQG